MTLWRRLRALWELLDEVPWTCERCHRPQATPMLLWPALRTSLVCRYCRYMQNYPDWIMSIDPLRKEFRL